MRRTYSIIGALFAILAFGLAIPAARAATATLQGTVTDANGLPISGATVEVGGGGYSPTVSTTLTNAQGQYSLVVPEGLNQILVTSPGSLAVPAMTIWSGVNLIAPVTTRDVSFPPGSVVSGHVSSNGNAVPNANVAIFPAVNTSTHFLTTTNSSGDYQLVLPVNDYQLQIDYKLAFGSTTPTSYVRYGFTSNFTVGPTATVIPNVNFTPVDHTVNILNGSVAATGRISWTGPTVAFSPQPPTGFRFLVDSTFTGTQTIPVLAVTSSSLSVSSPTGSSALASSTVDTLHSTSTSLQIAALSHATGNVVVPPNSQATISLVSPTNQTFVVRTTATGPFAIDAPDGDYTTHFDVTQYPNPAIGMSYSRTAAARVASTTDLGNFTFATVNQTLNLVDGNGQPTSGWLRWSSVGAGDRFSYDGPINGTAVIPTLPSSTTTLLGASSQFGPFALLGNFDTKLPNTSTITLATLFTVTGQVLLNGDPQPNASVTVAGPSGSFTGRTDTSGLFTIQAPNGNYTLSAFVVLNISPTLSVSLSRQFSTIAVSGSNVNTGSSNFTTVNQTLNLVDATGNSTTGSIQWFGGSETTGNFSIIGSLTGSTAMPTMGSATSLLSVGAPGGPLVAQPSVDTRTPTTTTITVPTFATVTGRMLINGRPMQSAAFYGTTSSFAIQLGTDGGFSLRIPTGSYRLTGNTTQPVGVGTSSTGTASFSANRFIDIMADTVLPDISMTTVEHTISVVGKTSSASIDWNGLAIVSNTPPPAAPDNNAFEVNAIFNSTMTVPVLATSATNFRVKAPLGNDILVTEPINTTSRSSSIVVGGTAQTFVVGPGDDDGDGVSNVLEALAPAADRNADGTSDYRQSNVANLPLTTDISPRYIAVAVPAPSALSGVQAAALSSVSVQPPSGTNFPDGLIRLNSSVSSPDLLVSIFTSSLNAQTGFAAYSEATGAWTQFPSDRITLNPSLGTVTIRVTDNGLGDADPNKGGIRILGGPVEGDVTPPTTTIPTTTLAPTTTTTTTTTTLAPTTTTTPTTTTLAPTTTTTTTTLAPTTTTTTVAKNCDKPGKAKSKFCI